MSSREPGSRRLCWFEESRGQMVATKWGFRPAFRSRTLVWAAMKGGRDGWWETWTDNGVSFAGSW